MELRHLRYFVAAAEAENVSRAALKLHVSQPALSRQIHDLEEELGFPLFKRSARAVSLTEAGRTFLQESRAVLARAQEAVNKTRAIALNDRREIHIGYAPSPTVRILPPTLRAFQTLLPQVRVKLHDLSTEEMLTGVREGKLQMAFVVHPGRAMLRGLRFEPLARDAMCLAVAPNHALAGLRSVDVAQAAKEPLVAYGRKDYPEYHEYLEALFATVKTRPRIVGEHDSAASLIAAVEAGSGVAVVPQSMSCTAGQRLRIIPLTPAPEPVVVGAVWVAGGLTTVVEQFLKCAIQAASKK